MKSDLMDTIYSKLIQSVMTNGQPVNFVAGKAKELSNVGWLLEDARNGIVLSPFRNLNYAYTVVAMLGLFQEGRKNVEPICHYNPDKAGFLNPQLDEWDGSYAHRLHKYNQLPKMYEILKRDPNSRKAVVSFYNPAHDFHYYESRNVCEALSLIFTVKNKKLNATATFRSQDLLELPYDVIQLTFLQSVLASWLHLEVGEYYHFTQSLVAFEQDEEQLQQISTQDWHIGTHPLKTMLPWDLAQKETYQEIKHFFAIERTIRRNPAALNTEIKRYRITSGALKHFLTMILLPQSFYASSYADKTR